MLETLDTSDSLSAACHTAKRLMSVHGEANAQSEAARLLDDYARLNDEQVADFFAFIGTEFNADPEAVKQAADIYHANPSANNLAKLFHLVEPRRQELLRRVNRAPNATAAILRMRERLLSLLPKHPDFSAIDADMLHLLSSWFNPGFLELHQITWDSPAKLLEKLIEHEAVHAIDGWDDLRRRLQPDRRCYTFFHPQLPGEPLIFVEVALVNGIASDVGPLLNKNAPAGDLGKVTAAMFYSISNCQPGLRGVSLGNFLIKRVAQRLAEEFPNIAMYSTLSPIPGFTKWLDSGAKVEAFASLPNDTQLLIQEARDVLKLGHTDWNKRLLSGWRPESANGQERDALTTLCCHYLLHGTASRCGDAVAKFHLSNGATLHRLNWAADLSPKGLLQSGGLMVNYLYELDKVELHHEAYTQGRIICSAAIASLL